VLSLVYILELILFSKEYFAIKVIFLIFTRRLQDGSYTRFTAYNRGIIHVADTS